MKKIRKVKEMIKQMNKKEDMLFQMLGLHYCKMQYFKELNFIKLY